MVGNRWIWLVEPAPTKYRFVGAGSQTIIAPNNFKNSPPSHGKYECTFRLLVGLGRVYGILGFPSI